MYIADDEKLHDLIKSKDKLKFITSYKGPYNVGSSEAYDVYNECRGLVDRVENASKIINEKFPDLKIKPTPQRILGIYDAISSSVDENVARCMILRDDENFISLFGNLFHLFNRAGVSCDTEAAEVIADYVEDPDVSIRYNLDDFSRERFLQNDFKTIAYDINYHKILNSGLQKLFDQGPTLSWMVDRISRAHQESYIEHRRSALFALISQMKSQENLLFISVDQINSYEDLIKGIDTTLDLARKVEESSTKIENEKFGFDQGDNLSDLIDSLDREISPINYDFHLNSIERLKLLRRFAAQEKNFFKKVLG